jgi:hypothetical protein
VVVVGDHLRDDRGEIVGIHAFYIDVSPQKPRTRSASPTPSTDWSNAAPASSSQGNVHAGIRIRRRCSLNVLRSLSQESNVKLRSVAEQIVSDFTAQAAADVFSRYPYDHLLVSAAERVREGHRCTRSEARR